MFNAITEYQLHDEGMQKMRPFRKLSLLHIDTLSLVLLCCALFDFRTSLNLLLILSYRRSVFDLNFISRDNENSKSWNKGT